MAALRFAVRVHLAAEGDGRKGVLPSQTCWAGLPGGGLVSSSPTVLVPLEWTTKTREESELNRKRIQGAWASMTSEVVEVDVTEQLQARRLNLLNNVRLIDLELGSSELERGLECAAAHLERKAAEIRSCGGLTADTVARMFEEQVVEIRKLGGK